MTAPQAKVRRDGQVTSIPASGIVAGDILALESTEEARKLTRSIMDSRLLPAKTEGDGAHEIAFASPRALLEARMIEAMDKAAGTDFGPAIPASDKALAAGDVKPVLKLISEETEHGIREHFQEALAKKRMKD